VSVESEEHIIDSKIARSYPAERERIVSQTVGVDQDIEAGTQKSSQGVSSPESDDSEVSSPPVLESHIPGHEEPFSPWVVDSKRSDQTSSTPILESDKSDEDEPAPASPQAHGVSPEYAEDDQTQKEAILDSRRKQNPDHSETIEEEPPALVKQASSKLVEQHLGPAAKYDKILSPEKISSKKHPSLDSGEVRFPSYSEYAELTEKEEALPDIVHLPFEDATTDIVLQGWEDQWFADAEVDVAKWGKIKEPKIDFVYTCESHSSKTS
jgi:hypothetical protein